MLVPISSLYPPMCFALFAADAERLLIADADAGAQLDGPPVVVSRRLQRVAGLLARCSERGLAAAELPLPQVVALDVIAQADGVYEEADALLAWGERAAGGGWA